MPTDPEVAEALLLLAALGFTEEAVQIGELLIFASLLQAQTGVTEGDDNVADLVGLNVVFGLGGDDTLAGSLIPLEGGNDLILGGSGNDLMIGGSFFPILGGLTTGNDTFIGGDGNDTVYGQDGNDSSLGSAGDDKHFGEAGNDTLWDVVGNNTLDGGAGDDSLLGGFDNDSINGGNSVFFGPSGGNDTIDGGFGDDVIDGNVGNDSIYGGWGDDNLTGGSGSDTLLGGVGEDILGGGSSQDTLTGGADADTFRFVNGDTGTTAAAADNITDWQSTDSIQLTGSAIAGYQELEAVAGETFAQMQARVNGAMDDDLRDIVAVQFGTSVVVWADFNNSGPASSNTQADGAIVLQNTTLADIDLSNFVL